MKDTERNRMKLYYQINVGDTRNVSNMANESVHFAITSPPYANVKDYTAASSNIGNYTGNEYFAMVTDVYKEVYRILRKGRMFVLNIADVPIRKKDGKMGLYDLGAETVRILESVGFEHKETVQWCKGRNRTRSNSPPGSLPYPPQPELLNNTEHCFIMRKPGKVEVNVSDDAREHSKMDTPFLRDVLYTAWQVKCETSSIHIAPYPIELVSRFIRLYSFETETVYDPFGGSFTTMLAAIRLHRSAASTEIGYVLQNHPSMTYWLDWVKDRLSWGFKPISGDEIEWKIADLGTGIPRDQLEKELSERIEKERNTPNEEISHEDTLDYHQENYENKEYYKEYWDRIFSGPEMHYNMGSKYKKRWTLDDLEEVSKPEVEQ